MSSFANNRIEKLFAMVFGLLSMQRVEENTWAMKLEVRDRATHQI